MKAITAYIEEQQACCMNCKHFRQHYGRESNGRNEYYFPMYEGHCVHPRLKNRKVTDSCERFEMKKQTQDVVYSVKSGTK